MSVMFLVSGLPHHGVVLRDGEGGGLGERFVLRLVDCSLLPAFRGRTDLWKREGRMGAE